MSFSCVTVRGWRVQAVCSSWSCAIALSTGDLAADVQPKFDPAIVVSDAVSGGERGKAFGALDKLPTGYVEEERFLSGTATSYKKAGTWGTDGRWDVTPAGTAPYKVRMLIRRPADAKRFNGILVVEWLNVSALIEGAADYMQMEEEIVREGYAWVGIGAQNAGINAPRSGLKAWDPARYAALMHPGDQYSYDIFSQALQALKHPVKPRARPAQGPLCHRHRPIAVGVSPGHVHQRRASAVADRRRLSRAQPPGRRCGIDGRWTRTRRRRADPAGRANFATTSRFRCSTS